MNFRRFALAAFAAALFASSAFAASPNVVISQVYGGGGNAGATLKNDFIELFNRGTSTVSLAGWSVQYASSAGTSWQVTNLSGSLAPGQYYLVQEAAGTGGTVSLPAPDASGGIAMSATAGKVALVNSTTSLSGTGCPFGATIVDFVGFGAANCFEDGAPVPTLANTTAAIRKDSGCTDTDSNSTDFVVGAPVAHNTASALHVCDVANAAPTITAPANPITTVAQGSAPFTVSLSGTDDNNIFNWSATPGSGVTAVTVASGQGTSSVTYNVTLNAAFSGTATFTASLSDNVNPAVTRTVNIAVTPTVVNDPPTITAFANPLVTVAQDAASFQLNFSGSDDNNVFNWSSSTLTGLTSATVSAGQGTANVTYTVTLAPGFSGTASFNVVLSDNVNPNVTLNATITVTPAPPPPLDHIVISQVYGGGGNSSATYHNDYVELYNPTTAAVDLGGWTIQYASSTGTTWQIQPLGGIMQPGEYYLVSLASGGAVGATLPLANINGSINISGTTGKIALSNTGDPFDGCPIGDPALVDLVGYGTANCREGGTNAPAPSNTTAIFRKNDGFTDTNVNGSDFQTGAPNPRRTTPIVEIGPYVLTVNPRANATTAPRDASINVTFTEEVNAEGGWFNINCVVTGNHNSSTVASAGNTWIITPNVNFQTGEQCTVTVFADFIHDTDLDDSNPNTDTLTANKTWSFTVATGTAPPEGDDVALTFGNPSGATTDPVADFNNYLMVKPEFTLSYNRDRGTPNWVSWHLTDEWVGSLTRVDTFRPDPAVLPTWYRVLDTDYFASGFDRGHMTPNADRDKETSIPINQATFLMSNMVPQSPDNNQGPWADLENYLRSLDLSHNELYIVSGPAGTGGTGSSGFATTIANGHVTVPASTWKVVLVMPKDSGDDVSRVTAGTRTIAVNMPNTQGIRNNDWTTYLTTVDAVEALTGYDFFANLPDAIENAIEAGTNGANKPGAANISISVNEDGSKPFNFDAVSPTNSALTYTITTGPSHGSVSGQTYTPAPDFNGSDSFTYTATDSSGTSNTATATIAVLEVNDPPSADNDSKSTDEDTTLTFAAADLTVNDSTGPANESTQTLTVSSVTSTTDTHGTLSLAAGQITYEPEADYNGPASFTYEVCDNGVTGGLGDAKCATATVNILVNAVNDAPVAGTDSFSFDWSAASISIEGAALLANDSAGEAMQTLHITGAGSATNGSVVPSETGFIFTPQANFTGVASFSYTVCDNGIPEQCSTGIVTINVNDAGAPIISNLSPSLSQLWPVNHLLVNLTINYDVKDFSDPSPQCTLSISSNEAVNGGGDGNTSADWHVIDDHHVQLRAERAGSGNGRTYTVQVRCADHSGNTSFATTTVSVPKSQK